MASPIPGPIPFATTTQSGQVSTALQSFSGYKRFEDGAVVYPYDITNSPWNALGDDTTPNSTAIQACIDAAGALVPPPPVFIPQGKFRLNEPIVLDAGAAGIVGQGIGIAKLIQGDNQPGGTVSWSGPMLICRPNTASLEFGPALLTGAGQAMEVNGTLNPSLLLVWHRYWINADGEDEFCLEWTANYSACSTPSCSVGCMGESAAEDVALGDPESISWALFQNENGGDFFCSGHITIGGVVYTVSGSDHPYNADTHIALTYDGANVRLFVNGTQEGGNVPATGTVTQWPWTSPGVGITPNGPAAFGGGLYGAGTGSIDGVRLSNVARYTANFTKPTAKFTLDANTLYLNNFDENFHDNMCSVGWSQTIGSPRKLFTPVSMEGAQSGGKLLESFSIESGSGILFELSPQSRISHVSISTGLVGLFLTGNSYLTKMDHVNIGECTYGLMFGNATSNCTYTEGQIRGGVYGVLAQYGSISFADVEFAPDAGSRAIMNYVSPYSAVFDNCFFDIETITSEFQCGIALDAAYSCTFIGGEFVNILTDAPVFRVRGNASQGISFVGSILDNAFGAHPLFEFSAATTQLAQPIGLFGCPQPTLGILCASGEEHNFGALVTMGPPVLAYTDASGSPGNATINRASGRVAIALGATQVVVTNDLVKSSTVVNVTKANLDATATDFKVVTGSGSFTITVNAAATNDLPFSFSLDNN